MTNNRFSEYLSYEPNGNIVRLDFNNYSYEFDYDSIGRLLIADHLSDNMYDYNVLNYDDNGNFDIMTRGDELLDYSYETGTNKVTEIICTGESITSKLYSYDADGNISNSPKADNIYYNIFNNMTKNITIDDISMNTAYDSAKNRIYKEVNGVKKGYLHGLSDYPLVELSNADVRKYYIYGSSGLIAQEDVSGTNYIVKDHLGSTRIVLNDNGFPIEQIDYDAFGNRMTSNVTANISYQYTGQEFDEEVDLHNFRARFYDSDLMRFYAVDPAEEFYSPYLYCGNNPINLIDPNGEETTGYGEDGIKIEDEEEKERIEKERKKKAKEEAIAKAKKEGKSDEEAEKAGQAAADATDDNDITAVVDGDGKIIEELPESINSVVPATDGEPIGLRREDFDEVGFGPTGTDEYGNKISIMNKRSVICNTGMNFQELAVSGETKQVIGVKVGAGEFAATFNSVYAKNSMPNSVMIQETPRSLGIATIRGSWHPSRMKWVERSRQYLIVNRNVKTDRNTRKIIEKLK